jgi:hypothetical protein
MGFRKGFRFIVGELLEVVNVYLSRSFHERMERRVDGSTDESLL